METALNERVMMSVTLANLAALRSYRRPRASFRSVFIKEYPVLLVETLGFDAIGDGGGIRWIYDAGDTSSPDDYPRVVVGADGARWKPERLNYMTPEMFGAIGDGVTDDSGALQNGIDTAKGPWLDGNSFFRGGVSFKLYGTYALLSPLLLDENILLDCKAVLVLKDDFAGDHVIKVTKTVHVTGTLSVKGNRRARSVLISNNANIASSYFPEFFIYGFPGFAIDIKPEGENANDVTIGRISGHECGQSKVVPFEKVRDEYVGNLRDQRSLIRLTGPAEEFLNEDTELLRNEADQSIHKVVRINGPTLEVHPVIPDSSGQVKLYSGGILRLDSTAATWDIRGIKGVRCHGIGFSARALRGSSVRYLHLEGSGAGFVVGNIKPRSDGTYAHQPGLRYSVLAAYMEGVDVPFLIEGRGSSVTIVEPSDEEVRRKAYWVFPYAEGGYAITRDGEFSGGYTREFIESSVKVPIHSGRRVLLKRRPGIVGTPRPPLITPVELVPYTPLAEFEIYVEDYDGGEVHISLNSTVRGYTVEGGSVHVLTPPPSGRHRYRIIVTGSDFRVF